MDRRALLLGVAGAFLIGLLLGVWIGTLIGHGVTTKAVTGASSLLSVHEKTITLLKSPARAKAGALPKALGDGVLLVLADRKTFEHPGGGFFRTYRVFCIGKDHSSSFINARPAVPYRLWYEPRGIGEFYTDETGLNASVSEGIALVQCDGLVPESELASELK